jgi:transposase InsO family protein
MWKPYLNVIAGKAGHALHVLDRFHITMHLNQAVDQVRRAESGRRRQGMRAQKLKRMRWQLLRRGSRVRGRAKQRLHGLLRANVATGRAWMLQENFRDFWRYRSVTWAGAFLAVWTERALRSRIEPMRKVARMLRAHQKLLMNWFRAKGEISAGAVEGLNNKIRVVTSLGRRAPAVANTDQGSQFTSAEYLEAMEAAKVRVSMDGRGRCLDNVFIERLWRRPHQALGYATPGELYRRPESYGAKPAAWVPSLNPDRFRW